MFKDTPSEVNIVEVGPRDGLQNEKKCLSYAELILVENLFKKGGADHERYGTGTQSLARQGR